MALLFIKLGGSLITDKTRQESFNADLMGRTAIEIADALHQFPDLQLVIGHGSGSFGHFAAQKYGTAQGVHTHQQWDDFAEVAYIARELHTLVLRTFHETTGLPMISMPPSVSAHVTDGRIVTMETDNIRTALDHGLIPLTCGDVAFDSVRGGTIISTETVFDYLAGILRPDRIFLLGEVEGVYDSGKQVVPHITPGNFDQVAPAITGSRGTDVTGGMLTKVRDMLALAGRAPGLQVRIFGATTPGQLADAILDRTRPGTLITG